MCSKCVLDEGTFSGWCPGCGCALGRINGEALCTAESCWCEKQPDVGDWHTLRDLDEPSLPPDWVEQTMKSWIEDSD
jgi:hypothetical protein